MQILVSEPLRGWQRRLAPHHCASTLGGLCYVNLFVDVKSRVLHCSVLYFSSVFLSSKKCRLSFDHLQYPPPTQT